MNEILESLKTPKAFGKITSSEERNTGNSLFSMYRKYIEESERLNKINFVNRIKHLNYCVDEVINAIIDEGGKPLNYFFNIDGSIFEVLIIIDSKTYSDPDKLLNIYRKITDAEIQASKSDLEVEFSLLDDSANLNIDLLRVHYPYNSVDQSE